MSHVRRRTLGSKSPGAASNKAGKLCECPVLPTAGNFLALGVDGHYSTTRKWAQIRAPLLVERKIPAGNRLASVTQHVRENFGPLGPIGQIVRTRVVGTTLGPVHGGIGMKLVELGHHLGGADVAVPGDCV